MFATMKNFLKLQGNTRWAYVVAGGVIGIIIALITFKPVICLYSYRSGADFFIGVLAAISGLVVLAANFLKDEKRKSESIKNAASMIGALIFFGLIAIIVSHWFITYDKNSCTPDFDTFVSLIGQEGSAVLHKDMATIKNIYTSDAIVESASGGAPQNAYTYYATKFASEDHCTNNHGSYTVINFTPTEVILTTSSRGSWGAAGQACTNLFDNPPGSDQWTFQMINGQWKIVNFEYNRPVPKP